MNKQIVRLGLHKTGMNGKSSLHRRVRRAANRTLRQHVSGLGESGAETEREEIREETFCEHAFADLRGDLRNPVLE